MRQLILGVAAAAAVLVFANGSAQACAWDGYGVSQCEVRGARWQRDEFKGESARGYAPAASSDPMVWSSDEWRSDLMSGYNQSSDNRYDRRVRRTHHVVRVERVEKIVRLRVEDERPAVRKPRRAKVIELGAEGGGEEVSVGRFVPHNCRGILILSSDGGARCVRNRARVRTAD